MESELKVGAILSRTIDLVRSNIGMTLAVFAILGGVGIFSDLSPIGDSLILPQSIAALVAQYFITRQLLDGLGLRDPDSRGRFWAMIGVGILTGLGIALGAAFLIVPGIYLAMRWSIAIPALIGEDFGITESMRISWERTRGNMLHIFLAFLIFYLPMIVGLVMIWLGAAAASASGTAPTPLVEAVLTNLLIQVSTVLAWYAAVAIYAPTADHSQELEQVFA